MKHITAELEKAINEEIASLGRCSYRGAIPDKMRTLKWVLAKAGCDVDTWPNHVEPLAEPIKVDVAASTEYAHKLESEIEARRFAETVTRALANQKETKVEWKSYNQSDITVSKTVEQAIAVQRSVGLRHDFTYSDEREALLDFLTVNWANLVFTETAPKPPCSEPYCHDTKHAHVGDSEATAGTVANKTCFYCMHGDRPELMGEKWFHANGAAIQAECKNPPNPQPSPAWYPCECGRLVPIWTANGWCANCNRAVYPTKDLTTPRTVRGCIRCHNPLNAGGQCDACAGTAGKSTVEQSTSPLYVPSLYVELSDRPVILVAIPVAANATDGVLTGVYTGQRQTYRIDSSRRDTGDDIAQACSKKT